MYKQIYAYMYICRERYKGVRIADMERRNKIN